MARASNVATSAKTRSDNRYVNVTGDTLTNTTNIFNSAATSYPLLSIGRSANQSVNFQVAARDHYISHRQDETAGDHDVRNVLWSSTAGNRRFHWEFANADGSTRRTKMTLTNSGSLGLGTDTPAYKLHVTDTGFFTANTSDGRVLRLRDRSTNGGNIIQFENGAGSNIWEVVGRSNEFYIYKNYGTSAGFKYRVDNNGNQAWNTNHLYLTNTGFLGIGTSTPDYNVHIVQDQASDATLFIANSRAYGLGQGNHGATIYLGKEESGYSSFILEATLGAILIIS